MLVDLTVKEFLNKVAGSDPVPGGGSIAALNGAIASALAAACRFACNSCLVVGADGFVSDEVTVVVVGVDTLDVETFDTPVDVLAELVELTNGTTAVADVAGETDVVVVVIV